MSASLQEGRRHVDRTSAVPAADESGGGGGAAEALDADLWLNSPIHAAHVTEPHTRPTSSNAADSQDSIGSDSDAPRRPLSSSTTHASFAAHHTGRRAPSTTTSSPGENPAGGTESTRALTGVRRRASAPELPHTPRTPAHPSAAASRVGPGPAAALPRRVLNLVDDTPRRAAQARAVASLTADPRLRAQILDMLFQ